MTVSSKLTVIWLYMFFSTCATPFSLFDNVWYFAFSFANGTAFSIAIELGVISNIDISFSPSPIAIISFVLIFKYSHILFTAFPFDTFGKKVIKYKFNNYRCLHIESKYREITKETKEAIEKCIKKV